MARAVRGQPVKPRAPVGPPAGAGERNYFASVVDELRKVVWPTWNELGRMTGVVITTVILMAVIISAADYGLGLVVNQLYRSGAANASATNQVQPSRISQGPTLRRPPTQTRPAIPPTLPTSAPGSTAPVTP